MARVAIAGYGQVKFSKDDSKIESVLLNSTKNLFDSTNNLTQKDIDAVLVSSNDNSKYLSAILSEMSGIQPKISHSIESLCNSGTNSIVAGYSYIASGLAMERRVTSAPTSKGRGKSTRLPAHMRRGRSMGGRKPPRAAWPSGPRRAVGAKDQK